VSARELACGHEFLWTSGCWTRPLFGWDLLSSSHTKQSYTV